MNLIAITGRARHGKDTLAKAFIEAGYRRTAFADALKEVTALIADEPTHLYYDDTAKEAHCPQLGMTRRKALQLLGTEGIRSVFGPNIWVNRVLARWHKDGNAPIVITDCRFDNEAQLVRDAGGIVIKVVRPGAEEISTGAAGHASEAGVHDSLVDIEIFNDGTVGDLLAEGRKIIEAYAAIEEEASHWPPYFDPSPEAVREAELERAELDLYSGR